MTGVLSSLPRAWLAALVESSLDCVILMDAGGIIVEVNEGVQETFGTPREQVLGRRLSEVFIPVESRARHEAGLQRYLATGESAILGRRIEVEALHASGRRVPIELSVVRLQGAEPAVFVGHLRNISERRQAERRLRLSAAAGQVLAVSVSPQDAIEGVLRAVGDHLQWPIVQFWQVDRHRETLRMLYAWAAGPAPDTISAGVFARGEGLPGRSWAEGQAIWLDDLSSADFPMKRREPLVAMGIESAFAFPVRVGRRIVAVVEAFRFTRESLDAELLALLESIGTQLGHVAAVHETRASLETNEAALRDALDQAERANAAKDEFLAMVSHELRTPLGPITGWARYLQQPLVDDARRLQGADAILRNAQLEARLVEDLLDVSRIVTGKLTLEKVSLSVVNVIDAAIETVALAATSKGVHLQVSGDFEVPPLSGDPKRLQQIFVNLLTNAVKFTPAGGDVNIALTVDAEVVEITVTDTGTGIAPDLLPHVFERFRQGGAKRHAESPGLGLGLSIVRDLVLAHGGSVTAHSDGPGQGATFRLRFPHEAGAQETMSPPP